MAPITPESHQSVIEPAYSDFFAKLAMQNERWASATSTSQRDLSLEPIRGAAWAEIVSLVRFSAVDHKLHSLQSLKGEPFEDAFIKALDALCDTLLKAYADDALSTADLEGHWDLMWAALESGMAATREPTHLVFAENHRALAFPPPFDAAPRKASGVGLSDEEEESAALQAEIHRTSSAIRSTRFNASAGWLAAWLQHVLRPQADNPLRWSRTFDIAGVSSLSGAARTRLELYVRCSLKMLYPEGGRRCVLEARSDNDAVQSLLLSDGEYHHFGSNPRTPYFIELDKGKPYSFTQETIDAWVEATR